MQHWHNTIDITRTAQGACSAASGSAAQSSPLRSQSAARLRHLRKVLSTLATTAVCIVATACGTMQEPAALPPTPAVAAGVVPDGGIRFDTTDKRIVQLWTAAEQARLNDNTDQAMRHLFEALEISPKNSLLWSRAAEIQLSNEQAALAENFASKSNSFAGNNDSLLHRNWLIIEHARSMRGDLLGVRSAHKKVQEYQYR